MRLFLSEALSFGQEFRLTLLSEKGEKKREERSKKNEGRVRYKPLVSALFPSLSLSLSVRDRRAPLRKKTLRMGGKTFLCLFSSRQASEPSDAQFRFPCRYLCLADRRLAGLLITKRIKEQRGRKNSAIALMDKNEAVDAICSPCPCVCVTCVTKCFLNCSHMAGHSSLFCGQDIRSAVITFASPVAMGMPKSLSICALVFVSKYGRLWKAFPMTRRCSVVPISRMRIRRKLKNLPGMG